MVTASLNKLERQQLSFELNKDRQLILKQIKQLMRYAQRAQASPYQQTSEIVLQLKSLKHEYKLIKYKLANPEAFYIKGEVYKFARIQLNKTALTGCHVKMRVNNDQCQTCTPLFMDVATKDLLDCMKEPINSLYNKGRFHGKNIPKFYGVNSIINPNRKNKKNMPYNIEDFVFPTRDYAKNPGKIYNEPLHEPINNWYIRNKSGMYVTNPAITGIALDINKSPFCVVDFDIKVSKDQRDEVIEYIKNKYGLVNGLVQTTSKGLHYYTRGSDDETFSHFTRVSRHIKAYTEKDAYDNVLFEVDVMVCDRDVGQSIIMGAGSQAKNSAGEIGEYTMIDNWTFNDLESFSSFETRFRAINNKWLVEPSKNIVANNVVKSKGVTSTSELDYYQVPNWELIEQLKGHTIHGYTGDIRAFPLMLAFASYSDEDYYKCIKYLNDNCIVTANASTQLSKSLDEIRSSKYFNPEISADARIRKQLNNYSL